MPSRAQVAELGVPGKVAECAKLEVRRSSFLGNENGNLVQQEQSVQVPTTPFFSFVGHGRKIYQEAKE